METTDILRAIIAHASDFNLMQRASRELRREVHTPNTLWRIYRQALSLPDTYPDAIRQAMSSYDSQMEQAQPSNKTVTVRFRCTENEKNALELFAAREGKTLSDYIRSRCLEER